MHLLKSAYDINGLNIDVFQSEKHIIKSTTQKKNFNTPSCFYLQHPFSILFISQDFHHFLLNTPKIFTLNLNKLIKHNILSKICKLIIFIVCFKRVDAVFLSSNYSIRWNWKLPMVDGSKVEYSEYLGSIPKHLSNENISIFTGAFNFFYNIGIYFFKSLHWSTVKMFRKRDQLITNLDK